MYHSEVPVLESLAIKKGVLLAHQLGITNLIVESDAKIVIDLLINPCNQASTLNIICDQTHFMSNQFSSVMFIWIPRCCNMAAHQAATLARLYKEEILWLDSLPIALSDVIRFDVF